MKSGGLAIRHFDSKLNRKYPIRAGPKKSSKMDLMKICPYCKVNEIKIFFMVPKY
jgi:hypothetical protein